MGRTADRILHQHAVWNYLTTPFLLTYLGVDARETEAWLEDGETWRRLQVTFPKTIATHDSDQVFYSDADYMLRRLDYHPGVTSAPIAHYVSDQKEFDGFVFPTQRHVYMRKEHGTADKSRAAATIDLLRWTSRSRRTPRSRPSTDPTF